MAMSDSSDSSDLDNPVLFKLKLKNLDKATLFKNVLEATSELFSRACFHFSDTGFELQAMDTHSVAFAVLFLPREALGGYRCISGLSAFLNLTDMARVFRCANKDDIITIKSEHGFTNVVRCKFKSPEDGEVSYFDFDYTDGLSYELPESVESEWKARIRMPSDKFVGICNKLSSLDDRNDDVVITVDKDGVMFYTGGKNGNSTIFRRKTQIVDKAIELKERVSVTLDLRLMTSFSKASSLSGEVTISIYSDLPTVFEYMIGEKGYIRYYLPQMLEDDTAKDDKMQS